MLKNFSFDVYEIDQKLSQFSVSPATSTLERLQDFPKLELHYCFVMKKNLFRQWIKIEMIFFHPFCN